MDEKLRMRIVAIGFLLNQAGWISIFLSERHKTMLANRRNDVGRNLLAIVTENLGDETATLEALREYETFIRTTGMV